MTASSLLLKPQPDEAFCSLLRYPPWRTCRHDAVQLLHPTNRNLPALTVIASSSADAPGAMEWSKVDEILARFKAPSASKERHLIALPEIPEFLCGVHRDVARNCRRVVQSAIHCGSMAEAVANQQFIPIQRAPAHIILDAVHRSITDEAEYVWLWPFGVAFHELAANPEDRGAWYRQVRKFLWESLDEFWFCLVYLSGELRLPIKTPYDSQRPQDSRYILLKLLNWWHAFESLDHCFYSGILEPQPGFRWGRATWELLREIGHEKTIFDLQRMDAEEAGEHLKQIAGYWA